MEVLEAFIPAMIPESIGNELVIGATADLIPPAASDD